MSGRIERVTRLGRQLPKIGIRTTAVERGEPSKAEMREQLTQAVINTTKPRKRA